MRQIQEWVSFEGKTLKAAFSQEFQPEPVTDQCSLRIYGWNHSQRPNETRQQEW